MKALCFNGPRDIDYSSVPDPRVEDDDDIIVSMKACSICGSDLHIYHGHGYTTDTGYCVGHEAVGEVVEIGRGVRRHKIGDQVMLSGAVGCGACARCVAGDSRNCLNNRQQVYGVGIGLQGCQAEAIRVPAADFNAALIPEGLDEVQALMLTDSLPTAWFGAKNADIRPGASVAVVGLGPIGLMAVECAFLLGASRVFAIDPIAERQTVATSLGAVALAPDEAIETVRELTHGVMADSAIEVAGSELSVKLAMKLVRRSGTVSAIGGSGIGRFDFPWRGAFSRGLTLRMGTCSVAAHWPELIPLVQQRRLRPERFVTHSTSLADGAEAYRVFDGRLEGALKVVMRP